MAALTEKEREDFSVVQTSTLTLLALLIAFSLSMVVGRYDQRKSLEEGEANAIGTEHARADLADPAVAPQIKSGLIRYTKLRLADFRTRDANELDRIGRETAELQSELWRLAAEVGREKPTPIGGLVVAGMNDVLNSQDYSQAARINHIPQGAWILMFAIALVACVAQGYGAKGSLRRGLLITVLPVTVALSLALISDIDSPRGGLIHVEPRNLMRLLHSLER